MNIKKIRAWDNGGLTADRYTVAISRTDKGQRVDDIYGMSDDPQSPQGFNQYSHTAPHGNHYPTDGIVGKRIKVQDLPPAVITAIEARLS